MDTFTANTGLLIAVCACCHQCSGVQEDGTVRPLTWGIVTCAECGCPCSCEGCVAEEELRD